MNIAIIAPVLLVSAHLISPTFDAAFDELKHQHDFRADRSGVVRALASHSDFVASPPSSSDLARLHG